MSEKNTETTKDKIAQKIIYNTTVEKCTNKPKEVKTAAGACPPVMWSWLVI